MTKVTVKTGVELEMHLVLNETEARALDALVGYGIDPFLKTFYEKLGRAYLGPHEQGLRNLFTQVGATVGQALGKMDEMRARLRAAGMSDTLKGVRVQ